MLFVLEMMPESYPFTANIGHQEGDCYHSAPFTLTEELFCLQEA
jgi:hypothetical protein